MYRAYKLASVRGSMRKAKVDSKSVMPNQPTVTAAVMKERAGLLLSRVGFGGERIVITRNGKPVAALVSIKDLEMLSGTAA